MDALGFVTLQLALIAFGAPVAFHPAIRRFSWPARVAAAFGAGALALTLEMVLFSFLGLRWGRRTVAVPLLTGATILSLIWARRPPFPRTRFRPSPLVAAGCGAVTVVTALLLLGSTMSGHATSPELFTIWGTKGVRFAVAKTFDLNYLRSPYTAHLNPAEPPMFSLTLSWYALGSEDPTWRFAPLSAFLWIVAAVPLLLEILRERLGDNGAAAVTTFWLVASSISAISTGAAGTADPLLIFYASVATAGSVAALSRKEPSLIVLSAVFVAGAALTGIDGTLAWMFLAAGFVVAVVVSRREDLAKAGWMVAIPAVCLSVWYLFLVLHRVPLFSGHDAYVIQTWSGVRWESIATAEVFGLGLGTGGLVWLIPFVILLTTVRRWSAAMIPPVTLAGGMLVVATARFFHAGQDAGTSASSAFPRLMAPALAALIIAAAVGSFSLPQEQSETTESTPAPSRP